ncbi:MAG: hypothetical protein IKF16_03030 [Lachnospiraceae bacterium]|nr:hypothetical protein [Lachnospiraceae bacterium]
MKTSKIIAGGLALVMAFGLAACGGSQGSTDGGSDSGEKVAFTIFNSKNEIQENLEEAAAAYGEANNVDIEVYYSQDTVAAHLSTRYASNEPYTISMVDAKDVYSLGKEYGYDMSGEEWVKDTDYAITVDDKVIGFPVCIEARGILYNADAIKNTTGEDFDPASIQTLDDFRAMLDKLVAAGMEAPTGVLKPDWSLAAHYLQQVYEEHADAGKMIPNYDYDPDDHYSKLGAEMQKYLADQCTREELAAAIEEYWKTVTPVEH